MRIGVKIDKLLNKPDSPVKAFASVTLDGAFAVHGLRVMVTQKGRFVNMPSQSYTDKSGQTQYSDMFHPIRKDARDYIQNAVLNAYDAAVQQAMAQNQSPQFEPEPDFGAPNMA